jgi:hypothetical protein
MAVLPLRRRWEAQRARVPPKTPPREATCASTSSSSNRMHRQWRHCPNRQRLHDAFDPCHQCCCRSSPRHQLLNHCRVVDAAMFVPMDRVTSPCPCRWSQDKATATWRSVNDNAAQRWAMRHRRPRRTEAASADHCRHPVLTMVQQHPQRPSPPHRPRQCARTRKQQQQKRRKMQARRVQRRRRLHAPLQQQWRGNFRLSSLRVDWCVLLCLCISLDARHICSNPSCVPMPGPDRCAGRGVAGSRSGLLRVRRSDVRGTAH